MQLAYLIDLFEEAAMEHKEFYSITQKALDRAVEATEQAFVELQSSNDGEGSSSHQISILSNLWVKLDDDVLAIYIETLAICLRCYTDSLDRYFKQDISNAGRDVEWDIHTVNGIIASHLYREGLFDVGDCFVREARVQDATASRSLFMELHHILDAMRSEDVGPAVNWAASHREQLLQNMSTLEMELHCRKYLELIQKGSRAEVVQYARNKLSPFILWSKRALEEWVASIFLKGLLGGHPHDGNTSLFQPEKLAEKLTREFCNLMGQPSRSPLTVAVAAGAVALLSVVSAESDQWDELLSSLVLPNDLRFQPLFVCPFTYELATAEDPPMMLPCRHVLCTSTILNLYTAEGRMRCPQCCQEYITIDDCKRIYL